MYVLKRLLQVIPALFVLSIIGFMINQMSPGDPVEQMLGGYGGQTGGGSDKVRAEQREIWRKKLGTDLPLFYIDIRSVAAPDTLYKVPKREKETVERLLERSGNWEATIAYYQQIAVVSQLLSEKRYKSLTSTKAADLSSVALEKIAKSGNHEVIKYELIALTTQLSSRANLAPVLVEAKKLNELYRYFLAHPTKWKNYVPSISFYANNQYHRWLFGDGGENTNGVIRGDFGMSYATNQPVQDIIWDRLFWSLLLTLLSVFLAYAISIPIGVYSAVNRGKFFDNASGTVLYALYAMPSFWVAILLLMVFANPKMLDLFPANGVMPIGGYAGEDIEITASSTWFSHWRRWWITAPQTLPYLVLPLICYTYGSVAFLSKSVRASYLDVMNEDFMKTAKSKGLSAKTVLFKHGLRNALLPLITVFPNIFPAAIGGSVILESVFGIPGMGTEILHAVTTQNYPIIQTVILLSGVLTMVGYAISDVLYMVVDPRINLK